MPCLEKMFDKQGDLIDTAPFIFNVELDELESFNKLLRGEGLFLLD